MDSASNSDDDDVVELPDYSDDIDISECLRLQHAELEMLTSMFPEALTLSDEESVAMFQSFVENLDDVVDIFQTQLPPNLSFDLKLQLDAVVAEEICSSDKKSCDDVVELSVTLPSLYPRLPPAVMLRTKFSKIQEGRLRRSIDAFLASQPEGELYVANLIEFVKEGIEGVFNANDGEEDVTKEGSSSKSELADKMVRMWIYSHHIYSMQKRKFILEWSRELDLTGFSMPGKPGIVCVEGREQAVDEIWTRLRKLNWKRLAIKERETISEGSTGDGDVGCSSGKLLKNQGLKFDDFEEISFDVKQGQGRNYHMDMGKFLEFLKSHDCERIFRLYFGVDGSS